MALFQKKETVVQNIAYMAIMAAINVIFVLLTAVLPPLMFLIVFVLPLTSTIVTLFCKKRLFPIYFIVTVGLCLLVTSGIYIFDTFFYVIPSLITGFVFGLLVQYKTPAIYVVLISTALQYVLTFLTFIIMNRIIADINFIDTLLAMFGLSDFVFKDVFVAIFLYTLASIQTVFTYVFIKYGIKMLGFEFNLELKNKWLPFLITCLSIVGAITLLFFYVPLTYVFFIFMLPLIIYQLIALIYERKNLIYILLGVSVLIEAIVFALFYTKLPHPKGIILLTPICFFISCLYFANNLFMKKTKEDKIDN